MEYIILDGRKMTGKAELHEYVASALKFPKHYGKNLDALSDCVSECCKGMTIRITNTMDMLDSVGGYGEAFLGVLEDLNDEGYIDFVREDM